MAFLRQVKKRYGHSMRYDGCRPGRVFSSEILKLIAQGRAAKEIGHELGLSPKTIDVHRARIMERLGLNDIANLTLYAVRKGLITP